MSNTKLGIVLLLCGLLVTAAVAQDIQDLVQVIRQGKLEEVKTILEKHPEWLNQGDNRDCRPLHWATNDNHIEIVKFLLKKGADMHVRDVDGDTPIYWAADAGRVEIGIYLIEQGAKIKDLNNYGDIPLHYSARRGFTEFSKIYEIPASFAMMTSDEQTHETAISTLQEVTAFDLQEFYGREQPSYLIAVPSQKLLACNQAALKANQKTAQEYIGQSVMGLWDDDKLMKLMGYLKNAPGNLIRQYEFVGRRWRRDVMGGEVLWRRDDKGVWNW